MRHLFVVSLFVACLFLEISNAVAVDEAPAGVTGQENAAATVVQPEQAPAAPAVTAQPIVAQPAVPAVAAQPAVADAVAPAPTQAPAAQALVAQPGPAIAYEPHSSYENDSAAAASVLGTSERRDEERGKRIALTPMVGGQFYSGAWSSYVNNYYNFGLLLEIPVSQMVSTEIETGFAQSRISYGVGPGVGQMHNFNQYNLGGNLKFYLTRPHSFFRPYAGAGLMGLYYENMYGIDMPSAFPGIPRYYNRMIGAGQLFLGGDIAVAESVSLGARGAFIQPLFNRPYTVSNGAFTAPAFGDAAAIDSSYFKVMGTVKIAF